tara:strand:+ start:139 stop:357 length:219 start_codon:yes stop_codon:yes gene_type:complete
MKTFIKLSKALMLLLHAIIQMKNNGQINPVVIEGIKPGLLLNSPIIIDIDELIRHIKELKNTLLANFGFKFE